jgi:peroxisomal coenzyme A diphosphatase NUDT7
VTGRDAAERGPRQRIPTPAVAKPGAAPPWAALARPELHGITLERVRAALAAHEPERQVPPPGARVASVLIALFEEDGEARVVLTRRTTTLPSHQGEVAFPGGKLDEGEDEVAGALREAEEEVGLDPATVEIVDGLDHMVTVASRFVLVPFVGFLPGRPTLTANDAEVEAIFDVSLAHLISDPVFRAEVWDVGAGEWPMYFFELDDDIVWGATARILFQLLHLVTGG